MSDSEGSPGTSLKRKAVNQLMDVSEYENVKGTWAVCGHGSSDEKAQMNGPVEDTPKGDERGRTRLRKKHRGALSRNDGDYGRKIGDQVRRERSCLRGGGSYARNGRH